MKRSTTRLRLRVAPGAGRAGVVGRHGDGWKVRVTAPPERGRANDDVVELVARSLGLRRSDVRIVAGATARDKVLELSGMDAVEVERRLAAAGAEEG